LAQATTTDSAHAKDAHHHSTKPYFVVWIILLACTGLTVFTGQHDLSHSLFSSANIVIALIIATIKASLVVWYFMHMREAAGTNRIVFVTSFVFLLVMIFGVFGDLWTRSQMSLPFHTPTTEGPEIVVPEGGQHAPAHHE
jgi:cytochrome c oxidase subunit 4